ncbi:MAG: YkgJ family cysteine cluster protein [Alphaproteobacteria bacterium]|nr:YkgJ family cysteine cluster protein [Alphaproteobacteria bacterium]
MRAAQRQGCPPMGDTPAPRQDPRQEAFGYVCHACSRCCQHKVIQVNPYEVARLARRTGQTVAQFRANCTENGAGNILRRDETDTCIFLGAKGCTVHPDRPLVCRLYPLGRQVAYDGSERWLHMEPHPQTAGEYTGKGTIAAFIAAQGALPFMRAADGYVEWVRRACTAIESGAGEMDAPDDVLDMDVAIARHCTETGAVEPSDIEDRRTLHMEILYRQLGQTMGGTHDQKDAIGSE